MNSPDLVQELGHRLNLTSLKMTGRICRLVFDRTIQIDIEDDGAGNLYFHTVLAPLPHHGREALLTALCSAHLFGLDTDGAVFGLHPKTRDLYLFRTLPLETLEVETTLKALERFTQQAENWKSRLAELIREIALPAEAAAAPTSALRA